MVDASLEISPCMASCFAVLLEVISNPLNSQKNPKENIWQLHQSQPSANKRQKPKTKTLLETYFYLFLNLHFIFFTQKEQVKQL